MSDWPIDFVALQDRVAVDGADAITDAQAGALLAIAEAAHGVYTDPGAAFPWGDLGVALHRFDFDRLEHPPALSPAGPTT